MAAADPVETLVPFRAEVAALLRLVAERGLEAGLAAVASGEERLAAVRAMEPRYDEMVQVMQEAVEPVQQKLQAEAQFMDQKAQACQQLESATKGVSEEMVEWLAANRLQEYAAHMALIAGACVHRADYTYLLTWLS